MSERMTPELVRKVLDWAKLGPQVVRVEADVMVAIAEDWLRLDSQEGKATSPSEAVAAVGSVIDALNQAQLAVMESMRVVARLQAGEDAVDAAAVVERVLKTVAMWCDRESDQAVKGGRKWSELGNLRYIRSMLDSRDMRTDIAADLVELDLAELGKLRRGFAIRELVRQRDALQVELAEAKSAWFADQRELEKLRAFGRGEPIA